MKLQQNYYFLYLNFIFIIGTSIHLSINDSIIYLLQVQEQFRQIEELYLTFAKKASAFNSWFENAEEDMTDPVRWASEGEIGWLQRFKRINNGR